MRRRVGALVTLVSVLGTLAAVAVPTASANQPVAYADGHHAQTKKKGGGTQYRQECSEPYPAQRIKANPLDLPTATGSDPLNGARFFVPGPAKGTAAGEIAKLLGLNPKTMPADESWAGFERQFTTGSLSYKLKSNPGLAKEIAELSKIASQPEAQRISSYSWGGTPSGIFKQTQKIFCSNLTADPGTVPIFNTYFMHPVLGGCPTPSDVRHYNGLFHRRIDAMAAGVGRRPAVLLLELDALGSSSCVSKMHAMPEWEADLRYEINKMRALPHTVVYVEGGYSDSNSVRYTARILNKIGIRKIRGFFTNDTHEQWTSNEARWATKISKLTHGAHFIVNTADNGRGPLYNKNKVKNGVEDLCNPPGRGLGPLDTTLTGFKYADAWMWTHPPGNSSGCGGGPPGGVFYLKRALQEAELANQQLGPGYPSRPY
jgi:hypothetical protein